MLYRVSPPCHSEHCTFLSSLGRITEELSLQMVRPFSILLIIGHSFYTWVGWGNACEEPFRRTQRRLGTSWSQSQVSTTTCSIGWLFAAFEFHWRFQILWTIWTNWGNDGWAELSFSNMTIPYSIRHALLVENAWMTLSHHPPTKLWLSPIRFSYLRAPQG